MSEINFNSLESAFFQQANTKVDEVAVLAEDIQLGGGLSWDSIFFEPQVGESCLVKFVTNIFGPQITHRKVYKNLPDPKRRGKNFHYTSSGSAKTCKVLDLFFELHKLKKDGDALAEQKIDEFLGQANQACVIVQILDCPRPELINQYRLFVFSTFGPNPEIANLIKKKTSPDEEMQKDGILPMNIFDVFESHCLRIKCEESEYDGKKGRSYGKSDWVTTKMRGCIVPMEDTDGNVTYAELKSSDKIVDANGNTVGVVESAKPQFQKLLEILKSDNLSIHNYFAYKEIDNPMNTEETNKYLIDVNAKVDEIVPIIRNAKSIAEIKAYGVAEQQSDSAQTINGKSKSDILKESMPNELNNLVTNEVTDNQTSTTTSNQNVSDDELMKELGIDS